MPQKGQRNRTFPKKVNEIGRFSKKLNNEIERFPKKVNEIEDFAKKVNIGIYWVDWLIWLNHLSHSFDLWVDSYILSNMPELIGIFKLYRVVVTESIHFPIWPRLSWLIWHESYTSLVPFIFKFDMREGQFHVRSGRNRSKFKQPFSFKNIPILIILSKYSKNVTNFDMRHLKMSKNRKRDIISFTWLSTNAQ